MLAKPPDLLQADPPVAGSGESDPRDAGPRDPSLTEAGKARRCIAGGPGANTDEMVRFVLAPDGAVAPDLARKLPGRGAWVSADRASIEKAAAKGLFARAFRRPAHLAPGETPAGFASRVEAGLTARALSAIGLARRSGDVVTGFEKVREALKSGPAAFLFTASDAADDGAGKLARLAAASRGPRAAPVRVVRAFTVEELSAALGREGVRHACLAPGPSAERIARELVRLAGFRQGLNEEPAAGPETGPGAPAALAPNADAAGAPEK